MGAFRNELITYIFIYFSISSSHEKKVQNHWIQNCWVIFNKGAFTNDVIKNAGFPTPNPRYPVTFNRPPDDVTLHQPPSKSNHVHYS